MKIEEPEWIRLQSYVKSYWTCVSLLNAGEAQEAAIYLPPERKSTLRQNLSSYKDLVGK